MPNVEWSIKGPHVANCNCDYGCPCQFNALPTDGSCRAVVAWRIDEGYHGDVRLDGLCAVNTYSWPGPIHKGGGQMQSIIDERANPAQRAALVSILQGEGAPPATIMLQIYRAMCSTVHPPLFKSIGMEFDLEGRSATLSVAGIIKTVVEPIRNPVTGAAHRARIELPMGKEFNLAEVASGTTAASGAVPLELEKSHAHLVYNRMTSGGIAAQ
ncbi:MAG: hypothetical protein A3G81_21500 [Betaproteobacteria bacterium RIFCSPLOWO2_12_FULL_65_14]|nr:MAG: hypothetical protein A3G81_21500 [Betaproteobacteria bacterium RIFCSPLOWO2_12_FULL_65_14]